MLSIASLLAKSRLNILKVIRLEPVISMEMVVKLQTCCFNVLFLFLNFCSPGSRFHFVCKPTAHCLAISNYFKVSDSKIARGDQVSLPAHLFCTPESDTELPRRYLEPHPQMLFRFSHRQF